jgi:hypothetical protein
MTRRILIALLLLFVAADAHAVLIRGQVYVQFPQGMAPMGGATVQLCVVGYPQCMGYMTGYDGLYYFNVNPGTYYVVVNGTPRIPPFFVPNQPYYDLVPVQGN